MVQGQSQWRGAERGNVATALSFLMDEGARQYKVCDLGTKNGFWQKRGGLRTQKESRWGVVSLKRDKKTTAPSKHFEKLVALT